MSRHILYASRRFLPANQRGTLLWVGMGLLNAAAKLFGLKHSDDARPQLARPVAHPHVLADELLEIRTAESLLIVTMSKVSAEELLHRTKEYQALKLIVSHSGNLASASVLFTPSESEDVPVKDPNKGWIIPLSPSTRAAIQTSLATTAGDYELTPQLAIVVNPTKDHTP